MFPFSKRFKYNSASVEDVLIGSEDCRHSEHRAWHQLVSNATQHARRCQRRQSFYSTHCHAARLEHIAFQSSAYWNFIGHVEHFLVCQKLRYTQGASNYYTRGCHLFEYVTIKLCRTLTLVGKGTSRVSGRQRRTNT